MHFFEKNKLKMTGLYIVYNAGSMYEDDTQRGIMHLMEHLMCKRLDDMQDEFTRRNIVFNAYTSEEQVVVYLTGLESQLNSNLKRTIVERFNNGSFVTEDDFLKEKDVIEQEYTSSFLDAENTCVINCIRQKYNNFLPIGDLKHILSITFNDVEMVFKKFFKTPSHIVEVGKEKTDFSFVIYNNVPLTKKKLKYGNYENQLEPLPKTEDDAVIVAIPKSPINKKDYPLMSVLNDILCDGLNSILYQELREKRGLVYAITDDRLKCVNDSIFLYSMITTKENAKDVVLIVRDVLTNLDKYITENRFSDVIDCSIIQLEIDNIFAYKNPKYLSKNLPSGYLTKNKFEKLTLTDIIEIGKKYLSNIDIVVY